MQIPLKDATELLGFGFRFISVVPWETMNISSTQNYTYHSNLYLHMQSRHRIRSAHRRITIINAYALIYLFSTLSQHSEFAIT